MLHVVLKVSESLRQEEGDCFQQGKKDKIGDKKIQLADDENNLVDFYGETLTLRVISIKTWTFVTQLKKQVETLSEFTPFFLGGRHQSSTIIVELAITTKTIWKWEERIQRRLKFM